jgi:hypothetical protein
LVTAISGSGAAERLWVKNREHQHGGENQHKRRQEKKDRFGCET